MPTAFIPTENPNSADAQPIENDGWYPALDPDDFKAQTGLSDVFRPEQVAAAIRAAMIEVNASIAWWRAAQTAQTLADVPAPSYGELSEKVILYTTAVFARARGELLRISRDYDSTKDGHDRADDLGNVAEDYQRQSAEALARLTGRGRMVVELI